ncbi:MAG: DUF167 domain-containing protein [Proteobacteria bacterium]|nr:DUF167 domain-containing protein [Pseudomonadota bacterium]
MKYDGKNLTINVRLTPKASANAIRDWGQTPNGAPCLKVSVTAAPDKGRANEALIRLLAVQFEVPRSKIEILRGETDRNKVIMIKDVPEEFPSIIKALTAGFFS